MCFRKNIYLILFINCIFALTGDELITLMENKPTPDNSKANMTMALINKKLNGRKIQSTTDWGIAPEWVEAAGFAFLAHQRIQEKVVDLTKTTGSKKKSILGAIYLPPQ